MSETKKQFFSAKRLATMGVFVALSFVASFWEIPLFSAAPFLKLDFSGVFIMLSGFLFGPVEGCVVCIVKELLRILISQTGGIGELANMLVGISFLLLPAVLYRFQKGLKSVCLSLVAACFIETAVALLANRFVLFPLWGAVDTFGSLFWILVAFNMIKSVSVSILTVLIYKRLSNLFKRWKI